MNIKFKNMFRKYRDDTSGNFAIMWAVSIATVILSVGSAYDLNQVNKAKRIAQIVADNMALTASIAVDTNNDVRYIEGQSYPYQELGGPEKDFTNSMEGTVAYDIIDNKDQKKDDQGQLVYDEHGQPVYEKLLARSTVTGSYTPAFMGAFGTNSIKFKASSDVAYAKREGTPASIFFVTDNSGSMGGRDNRYVRKINSLKTSMISFMNILSRVGAHDKKIFRTALFPYNYNTITGKVVNPKWNTLTNNSINLMSASGGTRSTDALTRAKNRFNLEDNIHENENGEEEPLKFLIFMSDGANNGTTTRTVCQDEQVWVPSQPERWVLHYNGNNYTYYSYRWWFSYYNVTHYPSGSGGYQTQQVCQQETYSPVNEASLQHCTYMKNHGVQIYSIAYDVSASQRTLAEDFMKKCSSNTENGVYTDNGFYKYATSGADLQAVFNAIGEAVVKEVVRVKR